MYRSYPTLQDGSSKYFSPPHQLQILIKIVSFCQAKKRKLEGTSTSASIDLPSVSSQVAFYLPDKNNDLQVASTTGIITTNDHDG